MQKQRVGSTFTVGETEPKGGRRSNQDTDQSGRECAKPRRNGSTAERPRVTLPATLQVQQSHFVVITQLKLSH